MIRYRFYKISVLTVVLILLFAWVWWPALWLLAIALPLIALGIVDVLQTRHSILRNFPVIGHIRFLFERIRPEIQQYLIESNIDAYPIEREMRSLVYQRAKGQLQTLPFGTQRDVYQVGYEWAAHSMAARHPQPAPRVQIGNDQCQQPYQSALLNTSAMSYGALSNRAVQALNEGAAIGGFAHNTGEGGISDFHLQAGGDLIWQIGSGYFGCRDEQGQFCPEKFRERAVLPSVKMIELKLSQGAKPGHGGMLPAAKVSAEIARIRLIPEAEDCISPPYHSAFGSPIELLEFIATLRQLSGGKPVGFKLCIGLRSDFFAICKAMLETGIYPDFITVDGGEGGTGAAPLEFSNSLGMPARDAWIFVHSALRGINLRDKVKVIASGKIINGFHMLRALALGADVCASARGMMLALGCIQSLRCNRNTCPTGIATQDPALIYALDVDDKAIRVAQYHGATLHAFSELLAAMGLESPAQLGPEHIFRRIDDLRVRNLAELYDFLEPGQLLDEDKLPAGLAQEWRRSRADRWQAIAEEGQYGGEALRETTA